MRTVRLPRRKRQGKKKAGQILKLIEMASKPAARAGRVFAIVSAVKIIAIKYG
jgi:hypothetical protein